MTNNKKRQLAAIMFTDIVGFSAMMQTDEEKAVEIRRRHRDVFRETHGKYGGKIIQYFGDGTLSVFDSAAAAVECAVEMQKEFEQDPKVPLRIGIHTGDITYDDEGAYGDGLNIAARIEPVCIPGGVYITGKVFDDIKNHSWLRAKPLGPFKLKNILHDVDLYAITSKGLPVHQERELAGLRKMPTVKAAPASAIEDGKKDKKQAAILALSLGVFGVHRFYLGQRRRAMWQLIIGLIGLIALFNGGAGFFAVLVVIAIIDAVLLNTMPQAEFEEKYNPSFSSRRPATREEQEYYQQGREVTEGARNPFKDSGLRKYRAGDYKGATAEFVRALDLDPEDMAIHFNLACCYSLQQDVDRSLYHLSKAVEYGFWDFDYIHQHKALVFVRDLPEFHNFVANDYRMVAQLPSPQEDLLSHKERQAPSTSNQKEPDLLDQIANLGDLLEKGVLTREEFDQQKRKLLSGE